MAVSLSLAAVLAGCTTLGPNYAAPALIAGSYSAPVSLGRPIAPDTAWWRDIGDTQLNRLVDLALAQNLTLAQATERVVSAREQAIIQGVGDLPNVTGTVQANLAGSSMRSEPTPSLNAGFDSSWEIDLFGANRRTREAALATFEAAVESANLARLVLLADVTQAYADLRGFQYRLRIARENLDSQTQTYRLTVARQAAGSGSELETAQATGSLRNAEADIPSLEASLASATNRLAVLLGQTPAALKGQLGSGDIPVFRGNVAAGMPGDLIRNRPDIRQAERQLAAATAEIGVAEAALYPSLRFSGSISISASSASAATWSLAPILTLPVFDGGAGRAQVNLAESEARTQYLAYRQTVLEAIEEVENGLMSVQREQRRRAALIASVESYKTALALTQERYAAGSASLQDVLDAQRALYGAREGYAQSAVALVSAYATLCKSLGGGWKAL